MYHPWKLLVYIAADNNLYDAAQVSLREITNSSLFSDVEIIVQVDGPSAQMASRYRCAGGGKRLIWEAPAHYTNDRKLRLAEFLDAAAARFDGNQRICLVLWGEGAGLDHVYLYSDPSDRVEPDKDGLQKATPHTPHKVSAQASAVMTPDQESMPLVTFDLLNSSNANRYVKDIELGTILLEFSRKIGRPIDLLGFDACLMALVEICYELRSSVSLVVGSDEELPKESWPYELILRDLARFPGMDASTLSTLIVSRFIEKYTALDERTRVSLSSIKLSASETLVGAVKRLVEGFNVIGDDVACKRRIFRARDSSRTADEASYIDFGVFCTELIESFDEGTPVHKSAKAIMFALKNDSYILYHRDAGEDGAFDPYGLALYFPQVLPTDTAGLGAAKAKFGLRTHDALDGKKDPPHDKKDPPHDKKDPPHDKKDPPHDKKFPPAGGSTPMEITSYQILWDSYVKLDFNKETGWADFVFRLLKDQS